jgi:hypothetical protein
MACHHDCSQVCCAVKAAGQSALATLRRFVSLSDLPSGGGPPPPAQTDRPPSSIRTATLRPSRLRICELQTGGFVHVAALEGLQGGVEAISHRRWSSVTLREDHASKDCAMPPLCRSSSGTLSRVADQVNDPSVGRSVRGVVECQPLAGEHEAPAMDAGPPVGFGQERLAELLVAVAVFGGGHQRTASAPGGSRTPNLLIRSQMLYPLSYRRSAPAYRRGPGAL